ncbi:MAG: hypothetical protein EPN55_07805 [Gammaproteobacteria bacterium]|nr:MAG: hypothetical protein EPN55_07805 [Gammaproteobacteria bacterium]
MGKRKPVPKSVEKDVLIASRRRCCLCVFLYDRNEVCKGQIAHLNQNPSDFRFENLAWLCLEHHDEYDGTTSQSKGLTLDEVREYRDRLYARHNWDAKQSSPDDAQAVELQALPETSEYETVRKNFAYELKFTLAPWRFPLWQVANRSEFFAYKAGNRADGICLIERIDLPDGRIVIACIEMAGNPGNSITNCVEELCFQVCERFDIPAERLVWLEHYDYDGRDEWDMVTFEQKPPRGPFASPEWTVMTPELWRELKLKPKKRITQWHGNYYSKLTKLFDWPTEALL